MFTEQLKTALDLCRQLKVTHPNRHISLGGCGTSFLWNRILREHPYVDSVAQFEGEETVIELVAELATGDCSTQVPGLWLKGCGEPSSREPILNLDNLPFPARDTPALKSSRHASLLSSRGCSRHCTFCLSGNYGNRHPDAIRWRPRSPENVFEEMVYLNRQYAVDRFSFVDDSFLGGRGQGAQRAVRLCQIIQDSGLGLSFSLECRSDEVSEELFCRLTRAGLKHVLLGVESADPAELRLYGKQETASQALDAIALLRELGLLVSIGFIMFQPLSTRESLRQNLEFLKVSRLATPGHLTNRLCLYEGSPLIRYYKQRGIQFQTSDFIYNYETADSSVAGAFDNFRALATRAEPLFNRLLGNVYEAQVSGKSWGDVSRRLNGASDLLAEAALHVLDKPRELAVALDTLAIDNR